MLNFSTSVGDIWKVLVFDVIGRNIISPLFSVKDLRGCGVTLHLFFCLFIFQWKFVQKVTNFVKFNRDYLKIAKLYHFLQKIIKNNKFY